MNEHQELAIKAIERYQGDDYARACREFRGMTEHELSLSWGCSGMTRREALEGYKRKHDACQAAIEWVKSQK